MTPTTRIVAAVNLAFGLLLGSQAHAVSYIHIDNAGAVNSYPSLADFAADTNSVFLGPGEINGAFGNDPGFFATPEPSSAVLATLGAASLAAWGWRRKRHA